MEQAQIAHICIHWFREKRNKNKGHEPITKLSWKCGPARDIYLHSFYLSLFLGVCRASAGACQCALPMDVNCHAQVTPGGRNSIIPSLGPWTSCGSREQSSVSSHPCISDWGVLRKKCLALQNSSANPSLGKFRWCYWWRLVRSPARARVLVLTAAFSITTIGVVILLSEPLWFHALKYKPIRAVFFSRVSLPNKQIELPRFIQSHP